MINEAPIDGPAIHGGYIPPGGIAGGDRLPLPKKPPPSPPKIHAPNPPPKSKTPGVENGVILSVDNANSPKYAMVALNNDIPPVLAMFACTAGPFAAGGTSGFHFFYNNSQNLGGSWCSVHVTAQGNQIVAVSTQVSTTAPIAVYGAITSHKHSGGPNSDGVQDPQPVNLGSNESQSNLPYNQHALSIQSVIDSAGNILSLEFPTGKINPDGSWTNVDGVSSVVNYTFQPGQPFTVTGDISKDQTGQPAGFILGTTTNGYGIWVDGAGVLSISKWVGGTRTALASQNVNNDVFYHSYSFTVVPGSPNQLEASLGGVYLQASDSSLSLT